MRWAASLGASRRYMWRWRATTRQASSLNVSRAARRGGAATASIAPVDGPDGTKDNKRMSEQKKENKSTKPLSLSTASRSGAAAKADANQVRQKFSHGRTRSVTVEVKKPVKRPPGAAPSAAASAPAP